MLVVPSCDPAVDDHRRAVSRALDIAVEIPDHDDAVAAPRSVQGLRQPRQCPRRCRGERRIQRQILDRIPGQGHLRKHDHVGTVMGGTDGPFDDRRRIRFEIADDGIDLGEGESEGLHRVDASARRPSLPGSENGVWRERPGTIDS